MMLEELLAAACSASQRVGATGANGMLPLAKDGWRRTG